jgi:hypothetical protein
MTFQPTEARPYRQYLETDDEHAQAAGRWCLKAEQACDAAARAARRGCAVLARLERDHALDAAAQAGLAADAADAAEAEACRAGRRAPLVTKARGLARLAGAVAQEANGLAYLARRKQQAREARR